MIESYKEIPSLDEKWDFWFSSTKNLSKNPKVSSKKESYFFIMDNETSEIDYVSNSVFDVLGFTAAEFTTNQLFKSIHPDDLDYCRECEYQFLQMSNNLFFNEQHRYSFQYSYRLMNKNEEYKTIQQHYFTIEVDDYGHILKTLVLHELIADYEVRAEDDFKIFDKYKSKSIICAKKYNLSSREWEILGLVHKGLTSSKIADTLFLSKCTIDTHRKNIIRKTNVNSLQELINKLY